MTCTGIITYNNLSYNCIHYRTDHKSRPSQNSEKPTCLPNLLPPVHVDKARRRDTSLPGDLELRCLPLASAWAVHSRTQSNIHSNKVFSNLRGHCPITEGCLLCSAYVFIIVARCRMAEEENENTRSETKRRSGTSFSTHINRTSTLPHFHNSTTHPVCTA